MDQISLDVGRTLPGHPLFDSFEPLCRGWMEREEGGGEGEGEEGEERGEVQRESPGEEVLRCLLVLYALRVCFLFFVFCFLFFVFCFLFFVFCFLFFVFCFLFFVFCFLFFVFCFLFFVFCFLFFVFLFFCFLFFVFCFCYFYFVIHSFIYLFIHSLGLNPRIFTINEFSWFHPPYCQFWQPSTFFLDSLWAGLFLFLFLFPLPNSPKPLLLLTLPPLLPQMENVLTDYHLHIDLLLSDGVLFDQLLGRLLPNLMKMWEERRIEWSGLLRPSTIYRFVWWDEEGGGIIIYFILFYFILFYFILFYFILFYFILFYIYLILFYFILFYIDLLIIFDFFF